MTLVVERVGRVRPPQDFPRFPFAHYGEQNGDSMRDPEMCFELAKLAGGSSL